MPPIASGPPIPVDQLPTEVRGGFPKGTMVRVALEAVSGGDERATGGDAAGSSGRIKGLLALKGIGARRYGPRTEQEITAQIREFRGDD